MAGLIHDLMDVLEEEISFYTILLEISKKKTDIIVLGDVSALQQLTTQEQEVVAKNLKLEKQREDIIEDIALVLNETKETLTIGKLIQRLQNTGEDQERLRQIQMEIQNILNELKQSNEQNKMLIKQSMEMVNFTMNAIQSTRSFTSNDYGVEGQIQNKTGRSFFDTRQ